MNIDFRRPVNQYIRTNRGMIPLSIQNLLEYTEISPKFTLRVPKHISLNEEIKKRNKIYSGSVYGYSGRRRMVIN